MNIRDRIKRLCRVRADELIPNPKNWRTHPKSQQDALKGILAEVGYVDALLAREVDGGLMLIDGHLRAETTPNSEVPVLVLDVDEAEADKILATFDPLAAMAQTNAKKLDEVLREVQTESEAVAAMLSELAESVGVVPEEESWPESTDDSRHVFQVTYTDDDLPALLSFLGVDDLPSNRTGKVILERIKAIFASGFGEQQDRGEVS